MTFTSDDMLRYSAVPGRPRVHVVGCTEPRVTIYSQQVRALNMVHALFDTGRLATDQNLVIVGAGFAGITAAVAAAVRGAKVTVLESHFSALHLQRGGIDRWVHPHLYDWPNEGSLTDDAGLPVMNWRAGEVWRVVENLLKGWEAALNKYPIDLQTGVTQVVLSVPIVRWTSQRQNSLRCQAVLVAVGFGVEAGISYWKDDGLELAPKDLSAFQVSGIGDGGLVDALRLRLGHQDPNQRFFAWLSKEFLPEVPPEVGKEVRAAERAVLVATGDERDAALELESRYETIVGSLKSRHADVVARMADRCRNDTTVRLVGKLPAPFSPKTSPLNRFLIAMLRGIDGRRFEYLEGTVDSVTGTVLDSHGREILLGARIHVMRLGPHPTALEASFPDVAVHLRNTARLVGLDAPRLPICGPSDFGTIDPVIADPGATP